MYSKEEARRIKADFWVGFSEATTRKWILYDTKIKDVAFKFYIDNKKAQVSLEIEPKNEELRILYFQKIESLKKLLLEHLPDAIFEQDFYLLNGKVLSKIWVEIDNVSVNKKNTWETVYDFFIEKMSAFELFFYEHEDYIKDLEINT